MTLKNKVVTVFKLYLLSFHDCSLSRTNIKLFNFSIVKVNFLISTFQNRLLYLSIEQKVLYEQQKRMDANLKIVHLRLSFMYNEELVNPRTYSKNSRLEETPVALLLDPFPM